MWKSLEPNGAFGLLQVIHIDIFVKEFEKRKSMGHFRIKIEQKPKATAKCAGSVHRRAVARVFDKPEFL